MQIVMLIGIILAVFGKMQFGTGDFPLILLGFMWVIGMLNFGIWKMKGLRKKQNVRKAGGHYETGSQKSEEKFWRERGPSWNKFFY